MKIRTDFVTNSSSNYYLIRNVTDSMKTMLDVMKECAEGEEWYLTSDEWDFDKEDYDENDYLTDGWEFINGVTSKGKKIPPKKRQLYLEKVELLQTFPPHTDIEISFSQHTGGGYGSICLRYSLRDSKSFRVKVTYR